MIDHHHLWVFPKSQLAGHRGPLSLDSQLWSTSRPFARGHPCVIHHHHHHPDLISMLWCVIKKCWWNFNDINDTLWNDADAASDDDGDESMAWPSAYITSRARQIRPACAPPLIPDLLLSGIIVMMNMKGMMMLSCIMLSSIAVMAL